MTSEPSSYSSIDHERDPDPEERCCGRYNPVEDPEEFCNLMSIMSVSLGIFLIAIGYIYPRDYEFDPYEEARVMEAIEIYYYNLGFKLDVLILMGMGLVVLGGMIYSILFMQMLCMWHGSWPLSGECCDSQDGQDIPLRDHSRQGEARTGAYGATATSN